MALGDSVLIVGDHHSRWRCTRDDCNAVGEMVDNAMKLAERTAETEEASDG